MKDRSLRTTSIVLAAIGLADAAYLTWIKISNSYAICGPIGDCESVNSSRYAEIGGVPIALLGAGAYLLILILLLLEPQGGVWKDYGSMVVFGISFAGVLFSAYLTYIEVAVLHAICPYCVLSAIVMLILLALTITRLVRSEGEPDLIPNE